jgi:hypothetical protein
MIKNQNLIELRLEAFGNDKSCEVNYAQPRPFNHGKDTKFSPQEGKNFWASPIVWLVEIKPQPQQQVDNESQHLLLVNSQGKEAGFLEKLKFWKHPVH